jgi:starvation-inducible DNA-binding protein
MVNGTANTLNDDANKRSFLNADNGEGAAKITATLNTLLADVFTLYFKTKNFHWHMSGPHFRDYHLMLDEHADQIFDMTDAIAERARKIGGSTLRSHQRYFPPPASAGQQRRICEPQGHTGGAL